MPQMDWRSPSLRRELRVSSQRAMSFGVRTMCTSVVAGMVLLVLCSHAIALASAQNTTEGWLNINCGATDTFVDPKTGLPWVPDDPYITTGELGTVPNADTKFPSFAEARTLRFFTDKRAGKFCYALPVAPLNTYMLRVNFFYGNYDNSADSPSFQISVDAVIFDSITANPAIGVWREATYTAQSNITYLCLLRDGTSVGNPFISSITLRPFPNAFIGFTEPLAMGKVISTVMRTNFGGTGITRYPGDAFDRYWFGHGANSTFFQSFVPRQDISTTNLISNRTSMSPPESVLQSAVTSSGNLTLVISGGVDINVYKNSELVLHFAELDPAANISTRQFYITSDAFQQSPLQNPSNYTTPPSPLVPSAWYFYDNTREIGQNTTVTLSPAAGSLEGPILNAMQFFHVVTGSLPMNELTFDRDVLAIADIKRDMNLTEWTGDPCIPAPHGWLNCTTISTATINRTEIIGVDLSGYQLSGPLSPSFAKLEALTYLRLENNNLSGPLPEWLPSLASLRVLSVQNNNFSGQIPPGILSANKLEFSYLPGNPLLVGGNGNTSPRSTTESSSKSGIIIGVVVGCVLGLITSVIIVIRIYKRRSSGAHHRKSQASRHPLVGGARAYTLAEVFTATENYKRQIGKGGFGPVYYGKLPDGREVAVKCLDALSQQGEAEFYNEVRLMSQIHHKNLVDLLGYCHEDGKHMLIYEFIALGSLEDYLRGSKSNDLKLLDWRTRLNIAANAAKGLEYLHTGNNAGIIHRDVKSPNILLTGKTDVAKMADFGISKLNEDDLTALLTDVKGSMGYLDPEYYTTNLLTYKSDVFSFGVVLLELLTALPPINKKPNTRMQECASLSEWARENLTAGRMDLVLDPILKGQQLNRDGLWRYAQTALQCVDKLPDRRPTMTQVVESLRVILSMER